jgi:hypothetical protein
MNFFKKYEIKQIYLNLKYKHFKKYFNNLSPYRNTIDSTLFIGINNLSDIKKLCNHKGKRYIFWIDTDFKSKLILNFNKIKIDKHFCNQQISIRELKKYKINLEIVYEYFTNDTPKFKILTNKKLISIAENLKENLHELNYDSEIIFNMNDIIECKSYIFILIYIKYFTELNNITPRKYIAYQMEQNSNISYFTPKYIDLLNNSYKIFDFSTSNDFYYNLLNKKVLINPFPLSKKQFKFKSTFDILFYGQFNERRIKILKHLNKKFDIIFKENCLGNNKNELIKKCKIVINLHFYDNACLETCRINEVLKFNKIVISENVNIKDLATKNLYENCVIFTDVINSNLDNIKNLEDKIIYCLQNYNNLLSKFDYNKIYNHCNNCLNNNLKI